MIYAKPYNWQEGDPTRHTIILDAFVAQPGFLTYPYPPEIARQAGAQLLTDPYNIIYESWRDRQFVGIIILTRVVPRVDALLHFLFVDKDLVGKRKLLTNFLGLCFTDLGFNRISMEIPDGVRLERFARKVLGFKLEGETRPRNPELPRSLTDNWVAKQGSRREQAHYDGEKWSDVLLLRLLASEWVGNGDKGGQCRFQSSPQPQHPSSEDSLAKP